MMTFYAETSLKLGKENKIPCNDPSQAPTKNRAKPPACDRIYNIISQAFQAIPESRLQARPHAFSRGGVLSPELLTTFLLYMAADGNRRGIRHLVPDFWEHAADHGLPLPVDAPVSASAICQARQRLHQDLFRDLLYALSSAQDSSGASAKGPRWHGRRVFAVDGAKINLRRSPDLDYAFGGPTGANCPQVLMSTLVDVLTRTPVDFEVSGYRASERDHLLLMLDSLDRGDLVVLDRGYPSHEVLQACAVAGVDFLMRVQGTNTFRAVESFRRSGALEAIVLLALPERADPEWHPLQVRLTRMEGPDGPSFYISSLLTNKISHADIAELYHMRWESEEYFKLFTSEYIGQKQFRSTSAQGVVQEIGALTLFLAISRLLAGAADESIQDRVEFASQKGAVLTLAVFLTRILLDPNPRTATSTVHRAIQRILLTRDRRRPGRSHPRRSFKPTPKWGPRGHSRD